MDPGICVSLPSLIRLDGCLIWKVKGLVRVPETWQESCCVTSSRPFLLLWLNSTAESNLQKKQFCLGVPEGESRMAGKSWSDCPEQEAESSRRNCTQEAETENMDPQSPPPVETPSSKTSILKAPQLPPNSVTNRVPSVQTHAPMSHLFKPPGFRVR